MSAACANHHGGRNFAPRVIPRCQVDQAWAALAPGMDSISERGACARMEAVAAECEWCQALFTDDKLRNYSISMAHAWLLKLGRMVRNSEAATDVHWSPSFDRNTEQLNFQNKLLAMLPPGDACVHVAFLEEKASNLIHAIRWFDGSLHQCAHGPHVTAFTGAMISMQDTLVHVRYMLDGLVKCEADKKDELMSPMEDEECDSTGL